MPPGVLVECELTIDQPLTWLPDGAWEWRFPTVVAPRYLGQPGRVPDAEALAVDVVEGGLPSRGSLSLQVGDPIDASAVVSPTHAICASGSAEGLRVAFASEAGVALDRDIAIRWRVGAPEPGVSVEVARPHADAPSSNHAYALVTITPPNVATSMRSSPRDLVLLIDTSGSMSGEPLEQARKIALALVDNLCDNDSLEMVEFSMRPTRWKRGPIQATRAYQGKARSWLNALRAGGGTEMATGVREAVRAVPGDDRLRQVVLITDGLIGFESEVVREVREAVGRGCRLHTVGVGPAANRSLTYAVARAGAGGEFLVGLDEDVDSTVRRVIARTSAPFITGVRVQGEAVVAGSTDVPRDLLAGAPALIPLRLNPEGGELVVIGNAAEGPWTVRTVAPGAEVGAGRSCVPRLFARDAIEELKARAAMGEKVNAEIERLALDHAIASRLTSWIAVSEEPTADPREPVRRTRIAQELPAGLSAEGLGLREAASMERLVVHGLMPSKRTFHTESDVSVEGLCFDRDPSAPSRKPPRARGCSRTLRDAGRVENHSLRGRLVTRDEYRIVVEIDAPESMGWAPVSVEVPGSEDVEIDRQHTTRPGRVEAGCTIRLVLRSVGGFPANLAVRHITVKGESDVRTLVVEIDDG
ncbi:MAG: VWA domain-containing protein [Planctomycetota bacterium]|nr:MAG: VWA domain-containing protein [Planctomycetota bacterium]